jgi:hypothetical protein
MLSIRKLTSEDDYGDTIFTNQNSNHLKFIKRLTQ